MTSGKELTFSEHADFDALGEAAETTAAGLWRDLARIGVVVDEAAARVRGVELGGRAASEEALARLAREHAEVDARRGRRAHGALRVLYDVVGRQAGELDVDVHAESEALHVAAVLAVGASGDRDVARRVVGAHVGAVGLLLAAYEELLARLARHTPVVPVGLGVAAYHARSLAHLHSPSYRLPVDNDCLCPLSESEL